MDVVKSLHDLISGLEGYSVRLNHDPDTLENYYNIYFLDKPVGYIPILDPASDIAVMIY